MLRANSGHHWLLGMVGHPSHLHQLNPVLCLTHRLKEAFEFFLEDNHDSNPSVATLADVLDPDIPVEKIVSVWRTAVTTSQINVPAYGQARPAQGSH